MRARRAHRAHTVWSETAGLVQAVLYAVATLTDFLVRGVV